MICVKEHSHTLVRKANLCHPFGRQFDITHKNKTKQTSMPFDQVIPLSAICPSEILIGHKNRYGRMCLAAMTYQCKSGAKHQWEKDRNRQKTG